MSIIAMTAALALQAAQGSSSIEGVWRSPGGNSIMKVAPCGNGPCGTVVWATDKAKKDSGKSVDQLVGTQLLTGLQQRKDGSWIGSLFIPDKKMRVTAKIERIAPDRLKVSGCAAGKALCRSSIWTAFTGTLPADSSVEAPK